MSRGASLVVPRTRASAPAGAVDRQLRATHDHPPDSLLISVPRFLQVRYDNIEAAAAAAAPADTHPAAALSGDATSSPLSIPAADAVAVTALYGMMPQGSDTGAAAWQFKQALTILYHLSRGSASPLLPYLAHLPGLSPGVPTPRVAMLMHDDAVDELQYGSIVQDVQNQKYWLRSVSSEVLGRLQHAPLASEAPSTAAVAQSPVAAAFGGLGVDPELFGWAVAVAMSRCFGLRRCATANPSTGPLLLGVERTALGGSGGCCTAVDASGLVQPGGQSLSEEGHESPGALLGGGVEERLGTNARPQHPVLYGTTGGGRQSSEPTGLAASRGS
jgi:hypothetical protein